MNKLHTVNSHTKGGNALKGRNHLTEKGKPK